MSALVRYLFLKHIREGGLYGLLLGPALVLIAPYVLYVILQIATGRFEWPLAINRYSLEGFKSVPELLMAVCAIGAAVAAFYAFAKEASNRSLGSFVLATKPRVLVMVASLFATVAGVVGYGVGRLTWTVLRSTFVGGPSTAAATSTATVIAQVIVVCAACAATGAAMISISPIPTMLVPAVFIAMATTVWQLNHFSGISAGLAMVQVVVMLAVATWFTRRQCAA